MVLLHGLVRNGGGLPASRASAAAMAAAAAAAAMAMARRHYHQQQALHDHQQQQQQQQQQQHCTLADLPPAIILLRHGQTAGLERLQELGVPNFRIPLSAQGVAQARAAGTTLRGLVAAAAAGDAAAAAGDAAAAAGDAAAAGERLRHHHQQHHPPPPPSQPPPPLHDDDGRGRVFFFTSPFLRCIQTAQHAARELAPGQFAGWKEAVQLREQDWGNLQAPGQQQHNANERLRYGRFFFRFPDGESAADVFDRLQLWQDHFIRDAALRRFRGASVCVVTHGLAMRLFLMRFLHWTTDDMLQVHNPPEATPIVLRRRPLPAASCGGGVGDGVVGSSSSISSSSSDGRGIHGGNNTNAPPPPPPLTAADVKQCYALDAAATESLRGVSPEMAAGRPVGRDLDSLLRYRPYQRQVPPPPEADAELERQLQALMRVGYGDGE